MYYFLIFFSLNSATNCVDCFSLSNRIFNSNSCICKSGYYEFSIAKCEACDNICKECSGPSSNNCLDCFESQNRVI